MSNCTFSIGDPIVWADDVRNTAKWKKALEFMKLIGNKPYYMVTELIDGNSGSANLPANENTKFVLIGVNNVKEYFDPSWFKRK